MAFSRFLRNSLAWCHSHLEGQSEMWNFARTFADRADGVTPRSALPQRCTSGGRPSARSGLAGDRLRPMRLCCACCVSE